MHMGLGYKGNTGGPLNFAGGCNYDGMLYAAGENCVETTRVVHHVSSSPLAISPLGCEKICKQLENLENLLEMAQACITCSSPLVTSPLLDRCEIATKRART